MPFNWFGKRAPGNVQRTARGQRRKLPRSRPTVERLEDRTVPSTLFVDVANGGDPNQDGSAAHPFGTIQQGVVAANPAGGDVIKYDPGLRRIYVACSSGAIAVIQKDDPYHYGKLEDFPVERKVHSIAVDPRTHRVYAPEEQEGGKPVAKIIVYEVTP